jgi:hypothetical protein
VTDLEPIFRACPALETLSLASCHGIGEHSLLPITAASSPALPALRELDASYCPVSAGAVAALLATTRLESLALNGCDGVSGECFEQLRALAAEGAGAGAAMGGEGAGQGGGGHRLASLSLVKCLNLRSLCLGLEPLQGKVGCRAAGAAGTCPCLGLCKAAPAPGSFPSPGLAAAPARRARPSPSWLAAALP